MITRRAWGYLAVAATRHAVTAIFLFGAPGDIADSAAFRLIRQTFPLQIWALIFSLISLTIIAGMIYGKEKLCRAGLIVSAFVTGSWTGAFIAGIYYYGIPPSPMLPIAWCALLLKDFVILSGPLRETKRSS